MGVVVHTKDKIGPESTRTIHLSLKKSEKYSAIDNVWYYV